MTNQIQNPNVKNLKKILPGLGKNILLKNYTSFRIGGRAKYFYIAKNKEDLIKAISAAKKFKLPFFILGNGSNVLVSDKGFDGVAIKMKNEKLKMKNYNSKFKIFCESGIPLAKLISKSLQIGAFGLEWAVGIPGTVGGAIYGNAGAFGNSMKDIVKEVEVFNAKELRIKNYELRDCRFDYRDSIFKQKKNLVILSAKIQLKKGKKEEIQEKMKEYLNERKKTQPLDFPSAGSIFKNYESRIMNYELLKEFSEIKEFNKKGQIPAAWLIEKCGLKGKRLGGAKISEKHANFIVNLGKAKSGDVAGLINLIKQKVKKKIGITLEEEIEYLGFEN
ncbi:UDP-N-acetylmuramate dehydrogenase [Patescibacteria group bacterium]|nr:UDP-N-acetylmuramate dehydrogenase [Patescibacteria group bacterium]MBU4481194.1 UDP-N-acetylmuramate dehydrogenase [Patescibacteria group bacterium]